MAEAKKKVTTKKEENNDGTTKKSDQATVQAASKGKEVSAKAAKPTKKTDKPKTTKAKSANVEEPIMQEADITRAAIDAAEQEGVVIAEKRSTTPVSEPGDSARTTLAKAGKRSAKAIKEDEEKQAKEERKAAKATETSADQGKSALRQKQRTAEDRLKARGKKYRKAYELVEKDKEYGLKEALDLAVKTSLVKFDAAVELHVNLGVDPKHADQNVRGTLVLPSGTGKTLRVAVLADSDDAAKATKAGADIAGNDDVLAALEKGAIKFDTLIAVPALMGKLGKYARLLGPKGLMPNPKSGTVTTDVVKAVKEAKAGKLEYRVDSTGIVHAAIGKTSFGTEKLLPNAQALLAGIKTAKPASIKGNYVKSIHITTSMGPGIKVTDSN